MSDGRQDELADLLAHGDASAVARSLSALLMAADQPFFHADLAGRSLTLSRGFEVAFGYSAGSVGRAFDDWRPRIRPDDAPRVITSALDAMRGGADVWVERLRIARADGTYAAVRVRAVILRDGARAIGLIGSLGVEQGADEQAEPQRRIDDLLERSTDTTFEKRRLELVLQAVDEAVYESEPAVARVHLSPGMQKLFGYSERAIDDAHAWWLERVHPDDRPGVDGSLQAFLCSGSEDRWTASYRFRHADGRFVTVRDRAFAIRDRAGAPVRLIGAMSVVAEGTTASSRPTVRLTPRQAEVLGLVRAGSTSKEIAARLGTSEQSVKEHVSNLLRRFGAPNRAALVTAADASHVVRDQPTGGGGG